VISLGPRAGVNCWQIHWCRYSQLGSAVVLVACLLDQKWKLERQSAPECTYCVLKFDICRSNTLLSVPTSREKGREREWIGKKTQYEGKGLVN